MDSCLTKSEVDCFWISLTKPEQAIATSILKNEYLPLAAFARQAWHVVEQGTPYIHGWHIDAICEHLEAVTRQQIKNLIINIPPGSTKTLTCSIMFPVWCWTRWHWMRFITASYSASLALESAEKSRDLVRSDKFRRLWPEIVIKEDKDTKSNFQVSRMIKEKGKTKFMHGGNGTPHR